MMAIIACSRFGPTLRARSSGGASSSSEVAAFGGGAWGLGWADEFGGQLRGGAN